MPDEPTQLMYREVQRAWRNGFLRAIMIFESITLTAILGAFAIKSSGTDRVALIIAWVVCVILMPALILGITLVTRIHGDRLRVKLPLFPGWNIPIDQIRSAEHRVLDPMRDLGGWGLKVTRKHGLVMNLHGNDFVTITLDNGKVRTIGTQRPQELLTAIRVLAELPPDESELELIETEA
jgi:hypothetical protein